MIQREGLEDQFKHLARTVHPGETIFQKALLLVCDIVMLMLKDQSENNKRVLRRERYGVSIGFYPIKAVPGRMDTTKNSLMN